MFEIEKNLTIAGSVSEYIASGFRFVLSLFSRSSVTRSTQTEPADFVTRQKFVTNSIFFVHVLPTPHTHTHV